MSEDLIKRSDAIEALNDCTDIKGFEYTQMHNALMEIQRADRPQGEWIYMDEPIIGNPYGSYGCSECGHIEPFTSAYCPNCGAKMERSRR